MTRILSKLLIVFLLASFALTSEACRFTVREIGFSYLSPTTYTLVVIERENQTDRSVVERLRTRAKQSNIQVLSIDIEKEKSHPYLKLALQAGLELPNAFLVGPNDRICRLFETEEYDLAKVPAVAEKCLFASPLQQSILSDIAENFAYVIRIPGMHSTENNEVDRLIQEDCLRLKDVMKIMPKYVENPPRQVLLTADECKQNRIILWSLGLETLPDHPVVHILYGRGRYMGTGLQLNDIRHGNVYRYLAMVGADCECNLDRSWMLGTQIPLLWTKATRQTLATTLDFDVDNPLIQSEMSRILSKEEPGGNATLSFTPETIDLDEVFNSDKKPQAASDTVQDASQFKTTSMLWITTGIILLIVIFISVYIIKRKKDY